MAHGLSEGEPIRFHITMHRGTAPNDIHIFIRLISSDSGTFSRHGTFIPILDKLCKRQTTGHPNQQQRMQFQYGLTPDSPTSPFLHFSATSQPGYHGNHGKFSLASSSNLSDELTLRWAHVFYNHNTLLCIDWQNFLLVQIETRGYQTIKILNCVITYFIFYPYII